MICCTLSKELVFYIMGTIFHKKIDCKNFIFTYLKGGAIMPLVSMKEMLETANKNRYAVGQFNVNNLEYVQAILQAAEEEKSPVILGVSEGAGKYMGGFNVVVAKIGRAHV